MNQKSLSSAAFSGAVWTYIQQFGSIGIQFLVAIILARLLEPAEFGLIGMLTIVIQVSNIFIQSGLTTSLIRSKIVDDKDLSTVFIFNLTVSLLFYLIIFLIAPLVSIFYSQPLLTDLLRVLSLTIVFNAFNVVQVTMLTKEMLFKRQAVIKVVSLSCSAIVGVTMAYNGFGVWSLVWNQIAHVIITTILFWKFSNWTPKLLFDKDKFKYHFKFGYKLTLSSLLNVFFENIYLIIIGRAFSAAQLGYYTQALKLRNLPVKTISNSLQKVTYPYFSKFKNDLELKQAFRKICIAVVYVVAPILMFISFLSDDIISVLFSSKWLPAAPYLSILCFAGILLPIHSFNLNILLVKGRSDLFFKLALIKKSLVLMVVIISINFGITGLIIGQLINSIIALPINAYYINKYLKYSIWQQSLDLAPAIILSGSIAGVLYLAKSVFSLQYALLNLVVYGIVAVILYLTFSKIFKLEGMINIQEIIFNKIGGGKTFLSKNILNPISKFITKRQVKLRNKPKVFVIGFNKTGTTTVFHALCEFDIIVGNQRKAELIMEDVINEDYKPLLDYCKTAEAFQDVPFSKPEIFKLLDKEFPNSKFILTVRDSSEQWFNSISKFQTKLNGIDGNLPTIEDLKNSKYVYKGWTYLVHSWTYGNDLFNKDNYSKVYEKHNADVVEHFKDRSDKLLVLNVSNRNGYIELCNFIGQKPLRDTFEWKNKT